MLGSTKNNMDVVITTDEFQSCLLPDDIYKKFISFSGIKNYGDYSLMPCDFDFKVQLKFELQDHKGNKAEWTVDESMLLPVWRTVKGKVCLIPIGSRKNRMNKSHKQQFIFGRSFFRSGCMLFDLEKKQMTMSRMLT